MSRTGCNYVWLKSPESEIKAALEPKSAAEALDENSHKEAHRIDSEEEENKVLKGE